MFFKKKTVFFFKHYMYTRMFSDRERESGRLERFEEALHGSKGADVAELRRLSWSGIPAKVRAFFLLSIFFYVNFPLHFSRPKSF